MTATALATELQTLKTCATIIRDWELEHVADELDEMTDVLEEIREDALNGNLDKKLAFGALCNMVRSLRAIESFMRDDECAAMADMFKEIHCNLLAIADSMTYEEENNNGI